MNGYGYIHCENLIPGNFNIMFLVYFTFVGGVFQCYMTQIHTDSWKRDEIDRLDFKIFFPLCENQ